MASRWLQDKKNKMKRMRRAYLKHYPSQGISPTKIAAHKIFQNRSRVRTTVGRQDQMSPIKDNSFMTPIAIQEGNAKPSGLVRPNTLISDCRILTVWATDRFMGIAEYKRGRLLSDYKGVRVLLYFDGARHIVVEQGTNHIAMSAVYDSSAEAEAAWTYDRVCWVHTERFDAGETQK